MVCCCYCRGREHRHTSHHHANTGNEGNELRLDAVGVGAGAKGGIVRAGREADAREEAVVGEDGEGVCEQAQDVDEVAQEEHLGGVFSMLFFLLI